MSARFEFAFSCSPGVIRSSEVETVRQTVISFPVTHGNNKDCNQDKKKRSTAPPTDTRLGHAHL